MDAGIQFQKSEILLQAYESPRDDIIRIVVDGIINKEKYGRICELSTIKTKLYADIRWDQMLSPKMNEGDSFRKVLPTEVWSILSKRILTASEAMSTVGWLMRAREGCMKSR